MEVVENIADVRVRRQAWLKQGEPVGVVVERDHTRLAALVSAEEALSPQQVDRIVALLDPREPVPRLTQATRAG